MTEGFHSTNLHQTCANFCIKHFPKNYKIVPTIVKTRILYGNYNVFKASYKIQYNSTHRPNSTVNAKYYLLHIKVLELCIKRPNGSHLRDKKCLENQMSTVLRCIELMTMKYCYTNAVT